MRIFLAPLLWLPLTAVEVDDVIRTNVVLTIDGDETTLPMGTATEVTIGGAQRRVTVRAGGKRFDDGRISFSFPAQHSVAVEAMGEGSIWTLNGDGSVLLLFQLAAGADPAATQGEFLAGMKDKLGKAAAKPRQGMINLGGTPYRSTGLAMTLGEQWLHQDSVVIQANGTNYILLVQDTPSEDGQPSAETAAALDLLRTTFRIAKR